MHTYRDKTKERYKFIDLFAGIGGIRIAFEKAGAKCVFSSEWDQWCAKTYEANFGDMPVGDITKVDANDIPPHDILTGGFPCQPFPSPEFRKRGASTAQRDSKMKPKELCFSTCAGS